MTKGRRDRSCLEIRHSVVICASTFVMTSKIRHVGTCRTLVTWSVIGAASPGGFAARYHAAPGARPAKRVPLWRLLADRHRRQSPARRNVRRLPRGPAPPRREILANQGGRCAAV